MSAMLPVPGDTAPRLADVLPSASASLLGEPNPLGLRAARSAVVVLVDGLGAANIAARAGHARWLSSHLARRDVLRTVFPSTTAAAIATFATGRMPGEHGLVGYRVLDAAHDRLVKQLSDWDDRMRPAEWQPLPTVFDAAAEVGLRPVVVAAPRYADSGFTRAVLRGAAFRGASSIAGRFAEALRAVDDGGALVYLYIPELDQAAHASGWSSDAWLELLEDLDAELARFDERMPRGTGLLVTADHGVIDVPATRHVFVDAAPALLEGVRHIGGEPRCLALYLEPGLGDRERAALAQAWRDAEGHRSWVLTRDEAISLGAYGTTVTDAARERIGDLLVAARAGIAYYDRRLPDRRAEAMIGQHGSATDEETRIPLARAGAYLRR